MSTIKSSDEHLTLNADGSSKDIKFQANGVEKASISSSGAFTSTTIDATKLTGTIPNFTSTGIDDNATSTSITINATENVGIEVTPESWEDNYPALQIGGQGSLGGHSGSEVYVNENVYRNGGNWKHINTGAASQYTGTGGQHKFKVTPSNSADANISWTDAMTIDNNGDVDLVDKLRLGKIGSTYTSGEGHSITSWAGDANSQTYLQARNVADTSNIMFVDVNSNTKIRFTAAGSGYWDGVGDAGAADYAEYFEWADGNPSNEDRVGMSVSMVGNKIKIAEDGDVVMGIVSARPAFVGDSASLGWQGKWETDVYGRRVQQDITVYSWEEVVENEDGKLVTKKQEYRHDKIPENVTVPDDATSVVRQEDKLSAEYDADADYVPRSNRKEWSAIGLMGKLKLRTGQVTDSRWIKMRDMSDTIEEWLVR